MHHFFVRPEQITDRLIRITGRDVNHIKNVLRMKTGEELEISDGTDAKEYHCGILALEAEEVVCEIRFVMEEGPELPAEIYLFQGLPKSDKMELIIQKCVELGVYRIIPFAAARSVVRLEEKKAAAKTARWQGIAEAAAKQSKRSIIPQVSEVCTMQQALAFARDMDVKLIPYERAEGMERTRELVNGIEPGQKVAVFIGPEGGFEEAEVELAREAGVIPVTLGKRILRTETAGMAVMSWLMFCLEK